jgi:hypothetical protein
MSAITCPFCQTQNKSGTRFCSNCGCSIHLTICPNPECGKISEVGAAKCAHCGQPFPNASNAPDGTGSVAGGDGNPGADSAATVKEKTRTAAWPLIMMAIVAGGLPLLWANRALLPTPDPWKANTSDTAKPTHVVPPTIPMTNAPAAAALAPATATTDSTNTPPPAGTTKPPSGPTSAGNATDANSNPPAKARNAQKKVRKAPVAKSPEPPRPCTEATAALGLCDATRTGK